MTDKDRILAVQYHDTDEAYKMGFNPDPDLRLLQNKSEGQIKERGMSPLQKHQYGKCIVINQKYKNGYKPC